MSPNIFNSIKVPQLPKNSFDLSHDLKLTLDMGQLVPIMVQECLPGDNFTLSGDVLLRFAPLIAPVMHRMDVSLHYFYVPNRIVWDNWEKWIAGDETVTAPYIRYGAASYALWPLMDYIGLPETVGSDIRVSALPFAAYQAVYNEYYRDENLVEEVNYQLVSGDNSSNQDLLALRRRAWMHDYFTSALPFAQKGPAVDIPLGQSVVELDNESTAVGRVRSAANHDTLLVGDLETGVGTSPGQFQSNNGTPTGAVYDPNGTLITETEPTTINELRRAFSLQRWLELAARAGTRYKEVLTAFFRVRSSDARLQRPEYITGVKTPVIISEVLNNTGETDGLPQGNMAGHGVSFTTGKFGTKYCEEHGFIIGVMSVMPLPAYQQGLPRHFGDRDDRFSYYWPQFANIGEQEVRNKEIYIDSDEKEGVFGYVPRYAEYRYTPSRTAGNFKNSLNFWTWTRIFDNEPALNKEFIECNPGKRPFAVVDENQNSLYAQVLNKVRATRSIPKFGTPI